ncbi:hypothetical protein ACFWN2_18675 [Lentzea sp. NPDC058436]|uniref:hypothetical protein n=1 Tax=Lentzea sp. NPDC058436 TaxID=3346499 RepID=UPI00365714C3
MLPKVAGAALPLVVLLVSCTGPSAETSSPAPSPTPSSSASAATTAPATTRNLTAQGFLPKKVGELSGTECTTSIDTCAIKFTVDKIDVNPKCYQYGTPAASGRKTLLLHVSLTTGNLSPDGQLGAPTIFNPFSLKGLSADGFVHDAQPGLCADNKSSLSSTILPNSKYAGTVEVDVPESAVSVASAWSAPAKDGGRGWVWSIG